MNPCCYYLENFIPFMAHDDFMGNSDQECNFRRCLVGGGAKLAKALFPDMNLQVYNFVRGTKTTQILNLSAFPPSPCLPAGTCMIVTLTASWQFTNSLTIKRGSFSTISRTIEVEEEI